MGPLGKNGAGKTTLLSLISGLRSQTSGKITVLDEKMPARSTEFRRKMGFVLQENALYEELTVFENLKFSSTLYDVQNSRKRILEVLEILGLSDRRDQVVSTLQEASRDALRLHVLSFTTRSCSLLTSPRLELTWIHVMRFGLTFAFSDQRARQLLLRLIISTKP